MATLPLACPDCRAEVEPQDGAFVCARGHVAGRVDDGIPNFCAGREGVDRELVEFWNAAEGYYELAQSRNEDIEDVDHEGHRVVLAALAQAAPHLVLDVGCGTGEFARALHERAPATSYVGVDVSVKALRATRALGRPGTFVAGDAERLPFADASFDAVVSFFALEHFPDARSSIAEMVRVLRPGGLLAILSPSFDAPWATVPSMRFGLRRRRDSMSRFHPANVAVYAARRAHFAARQALKQVRFVFDRRYIPFDRVERPLVLDEVYLPDFDVIHVVSGRGVTRELERLGCAILETTAPTRGFGQLAMPMTYRVLARKGASRRGRD